VALELHVDDGAHDLGNATDLVGCCSHSIISFDQNYCAVHRTAMLSLLP